MDRARRISSRFRAPEALLRGSGGFSLVELIVVMAIFIIVIIATSNAFNTLVTHSVQQTKLAESQTGGIIGLEMMRADLEHAGYGLPWSFQSNPNYTEPDLGADLADAPTGVPRAVHIGDNQGPSGSDRLVIRSTVAGTEPTAKKWTYATYSSVGSALKTWNTVEDLAAGEKVIVVRATNVDGVQGKQLIVSSAGAFFTNYPPAGDFRPQSSSDLHLVYGIRPAAADVVRPFNRVDYYLDTPNNPEMLPKSCAPNTFTLFKGVVNHGGTVPVTPYPLLDCVADMQVIFGVDTSGDGEVDMHLNEVSASAQDIREQVKEVRVYILAQEGTKDRAFRYPSQKVRLGDFDPSLGSEFDLATIGADWRNYRWRVYTVVVNPKNLAN